MLTTRFIVAVLSAGSIFPCATAAWAQSFPSKPVRIMASSPGSGIDVISRLIAHDLSSALAQQVIVENRGGSVIVRAQVVFTAAPDGHTLLVTGASHWLLPLMQKNLPFDPVKDFSPVIFAAIQPNALAVHPSLPAKSVKELIALAKANPGELNIATGAPGALTHLAAELFKDMAGIKMVSVPYRGSGPALASLFSGETQVMFPVMLQIAPHFKLGKVRVLAVTATNPVSTFPGVPTVAATLPDYEAGAKYGIFAPAKTPGPIISRLNREIARVLSAPEIRERLAKVGAEGIGGSPEELVTTMRRDVVLWGKVIKEAGIVVE